MKGLIFGATGATGNFLVTHLVQSNKWNKVHVIVRKPLPEWNDFKYKQKLIIQIQQNLDKLLRPQDWKFEGYDAVFVCLGCEIKHGQQMFRKIDKQIPLSIADIAINNNIPHYLIVTAQMADSQSSFLYIRVKGQVQNELSKKKVKMISILKPGLIANRINTRLGQKIVNCLCGCCIRKIECTDLAKCMIILVDKKKGSSGIQRLNNNQLLQLLQ